MENLKLNCELKIYKNDELVNTFIKESINALIELSKVTSEFINKKHYYNIEKIKIDSDHIKEYVKIKVIYKNEYHDGIVKFTYDYLFNGSDIKKVYTF